jgi:spore germination cell wall hydrolase CwlJ-like protein
MTLMAIAALCAAAAGGGKPASGTDCAAVGRQYQAAITLVTPMLTAPDDRDAIARVAYAEAGNQGDSGLAGVIYTIVNRMIDGGFGGGVGAVLNAPGQFEPVTRAGGWQKLPVRSVVEQAHVDTILNLALDGRLPDPTNGARYFQNPTIVAGRAAAGTVSAGLVNFGGQKPLAVIRDHAFFDGGSKSAAHTGSAPSLFARMQTGSTGGNEGEAAANLSQPSGLFVPLDH